MSNLLIFHAVHMICHNRMQIALCPWHLPCIGRRIIRIESDRLAHIRLCRLSIGCILHMQKGYRSCVGSSQGNGRGICTYIGSDAAYPNVWPPLGLVFIMKLYILYLGCVCGNEFHCWTSVFILCYNFMSLVLLCSFWCMWFCVMIYALVIYCLWFNPGCYSGWIAVSSDPGYFLWTQSHCGLNQQ